MEVGWIRYTRHQNVDVPLSEDALQTSKYEVPYRKGLNFVDLLKLYIYTLQYFYYALYHMYIVYRT